MRYAGVFKARRAKQENRTHRMVLGNLQGALETPRQLEGVYRKAAPACPKTVCLRQQIEIAEGNPRIRLLARRLTGRGGNDHAGRVAEDDVVAEPDAIASDRPARAHGKTVLTVNAKLFILRLYSIPR